MRKVRKDKKYPCVLCEKPLFTLCLFFFMSRYYRVTASINGYYRTIRIYVPVLPFSDNFACLFNLLFAPIHYTVRLQIKVSLYSFNTEIGCVDFACNSL